MLCRLSLVCLSPTAPFPVLHTTVALSLLPCLPAGKDFMEVCAMHIDVLGTRPPEELAYIRSDQALQFLAAIPYKPKKVSHRPLTRRCSSGRTSLQAQEGELVADSASFGSHQSDDQAATASLPPPALLAL